MDNKITIIIPVHELNETIEVLLSNAIKSVDNQKSNLPIILVYSNKIKDVISNFFQKNSFESTIEFIINENKTDFQSQINLAVKSVKTEYFSILEFDDEYALTYSKTMSNYIEFNKDTDVLLPIIIEVDNNGGWVKFTNEGSWAQQLIGENGEAGFLNNNILNQYTDFKLSGALIKKQTFIDIGGFKSNIEMTFMLEFIYRLLNNTGKLFTVSKFLYKHLSTRVDSITDHYVKTMNVTERKFWFETAKKESNFSNDRTIDITGLNK